MFKSVSKLPMTKNITDGYHAFMFKSEQQTGVLKGREKPSLSMLFYGRDVRRKEICKY